MKKNTTKNETVKKKSKVKSRKDKMQIWVKKETVAYEKELARL